MRKLAPLRVSYRDDFLISYRVYMVTGSFHISLFEDTLHVDKIHVWFKIANITHALPFPVHLQTKRPTRVDVSRLHDTVARFRTGVKFSPRYEKKHQQELFRTCLTSVRAIIRISMSILTRLKRNASSIRNSVWPRENSVIVVREPSQIPNSCNHLSGVLNSERNDADFPWSET